MPLSKHLLKEKEGQYFDFNSWGVSLAYKGVAENCKIATVSFFPGSAPVSVNKIPATMRDGSTRGNIRRCLSRRFLKMLRLKAHKVPSG